MDEKIFIRQQWQRESSKQGKQQECRTQEVIKETREPSEEH